MEEYLQIGVISSTHGLKGEVKVFPTTDDPQRFKLLKTVLLNTGKEKTELNIQGVKFFKKFVILKFKEFDNINDIEKYKGKELFVARENALPLKENEYYVTDLIDLEVYLDTGELFGTLTDVLETGANDVYVVTTPEGKEILLPAIKECILTIDMEKRQMNIHLMEGLV